MTSPADPPYASLIPQLDDALRRFRIKARFIWFVVCPIVVVLCATIVLLILEKFKLGLFATPMETLSVLMVIFVPLLMLLFSPIAYRAYFNATKAGLLKLKTAAWKGGLYGFGVPAIIALLMYGLAVLIPDNGYSDSPNFLFAMLTIQALVIAVFGLLIGPLAATGFGAILRRMDPRYPRNV